MYNWLLLAFNKFNNINDTCTEINTSTENKKGLCQMCLLYNNIMIQIYIYLLNRLMNMLIIHQS